MIRLFCILALLAFGALTPAFAESILQQLENGTPLNEIQCSTDKTLVQSQTGKPACVYEDTAKKLESRGWGIVLQDTAYSLQPDWLESDKEHLDENGTLNSVLVVGSSPVESEFRSGELITHSMYTACFGKLPSNISLEVPRRAELGEFFDARIVISFEGHDEQYWQNNCFDHNLNIRYPPNYNAVGNELLEGVEAGNPDYLPPIISRGVFVENMEYNRPPITFQMKIDEPKDGVYDFGSIGVSSNHATVKTIVYTQINNGSVYFSDEKFASGQSDENRPKPKPENYLPPNLKFKQHNQTGEGEILFEWVAESLENEMREETVESLIRGLGLDDDYLREFLEAYPKFKTQSFDPVLNWILPQALGQNSPTFVLVNGRVTALNYDGNVVPVHGINVTAFDAQITGNAEPVFNSVYAY